MCESGIFFCLFRWIDLGQKSLSRKTAKAFALYALANGLLREQSHTCREICFPMQFRGFPNRDRSNGWQVFEATWLQYKSLPRKIRLAIFGWLDFRDVSAHRATVLCWLYTSTNRTSVSKVHFYRLRNSVKSSDRRDSTVPRERILRDYIGWFQDTQYRVQATKKDRLLPEL